MPALAWVPLSDSTARRLYALAKAEAIAPEELAGRVIAEHTGTPQARRVLRTQSAAAKAGNADAMLVKLENSIERHWKKHPSQRTGNENIIMAAMALIREVNNGGFDQFFRNSSARWAGFAPEAMLHVGRKDAARIARRALKAVGQFTSVAELEAKMRQPNDKRDEVLNECDIAFYHLTGLPESALAYARQHLDGLLRR